MGDFGDHVGVFFIAGFFLALLALPEAVLVATIHVIQLVWAPAESWIACVCLALAAAAFVATRRGWHVFGGRTLYRIAKDMATTLRLAMGQKQVRDRAETPSRCPVAPFEMSHPLDCPSYHVKGSIS